MVASSCCNETNQTPQGVLDKGITSLAVCLKHSFLFPEHEQQVGQLATSMGFNQISLSSDVMPMVKMVPRGYTAAADAYLTPHIMRYIMCNAALSTCIMRSMLCMMCKWCQHRCSHCEVYVVLT